MATWVQQAAHGYDQGHRELAASTTLPKAAANLLAKQSDLTGPSPPPKGFYEYVSAYPLGGEWYALGKTWYADDVRRPGCVWTHTFLLQREALAELQGLEPLLAYFVRPSLTEEKLAQFRTPVELGSQRPTRRQSESKCATLMLTALGTRSDATVFARAAKSEDLLIPALHARDVLWPSIGARLALSTGSLAPRTLRRGVPFDLQVVPREGGSSFARLRRSQGAVALESIEGAATWADAIVRDRAARETRPGWDGDLPAHRALIPAYGRLMAASPRSGPLSQKLVVNALARSEEPLVLSRLLLSQLGRTWFGHPCSDLALALLTDPSPEVAEMWTDSMIEKIRATHLRAVGRLLSQVPLSSLNSGGERLLRRLDVLGESPAVDSAQQRHGGSEDREPADVLPSTQDRSEALKILVESPSAVDVRGLVEAFGEAAIFDLLDELDSHPEQHMRIGAWAQRLPTWRHVVSNWVASRARTTSRSSMRVAMAALQPTSEAVGAIPSRAWFDSIDGAQSDLSGRKLRPVVFYLSRWLSAPCELEPDRALLLARAFDWVHSKAMKDRLRRDVRDWLEPALPDLGYGNWDWARRLRLAFLAAWSRSHIPPGILLSESLSDQTVEQLLRTAPDSEEGRSILRSLAESAPSLSWRRAYWLEQAVREMRFRKW